MINTNSKVEQSWEYPNSFNELSTSSEALTNNVIDAENTVSKIILPYIIENNSTVEDNIVDKVIDEANVDNALISTKSEAESFFIPWIDQEW